MKPLLRIAGLLAILSASAFASTISYSQTFTIDLTPTYQATSLAVAGFDSSLGTLTAVTFTADTTLYGGYAVTNLSPQSNDVTLTAPLTVSLASGTTPLADFTTATLIEALTLAPGATATSSSSYVAGVISYSNLVVTATGSASSTVTDPAILALFGAGTTVNVDANGTVADQWTHHGNEEGSLTTAYTGLVTVTYTYATPEPGTIAMAFGGMACLVFGLRRRRAA
jgi:hypothetical protein